MDEVTQKLATKSKEFNALKNQLTTMEDTVLTKEKELRAAHDDAANNQSMNESLSIENAKLKNILSETEKKNEDLLETVDKLKQAVPEPCVMEQLLEKNKEKDKEIEDLKENIDFTEKSLGEQLTEKIKAKEQEALHLQETLETAKKSLEDSKALLKTETSKTRQAQGLLKKEQERRIFFQEESSSLSLKLAEANAQLGRKRLLMNTSADRSGEKCANESDGSVNMNDEKNSGTKEAGGFESRTVERSPCIFELKKAGSCLRKDKCKFDHKLSQTNSEEVSKILVETSSRIGRCAFEMTERGSCPGQPTCTFSHEKPIKTVHGTENQPERTRVCFRELVEEGSCQWGDAKCRFSHKISAEQRADTNYVQARRKEKDEKASKCIHEFRSVGGCRNKERCSFSHGITEEDRNDAALKENINEKLSVIRNKQEKKKQVQSSGVDTSGKISAEVATLREELLQMKQLMMSMKSP